MRELVRQEMEAGAILVEQAGDLKQAHDPVAEELLGGSGVEMGHGHPVCGGGSVAGQA